MTTREEVLAAIKRAGDSPTLDMELCTEAAGSLVDFGILIEDDDGQFACDMMLLKQTVEGLPEDDGKAILEFVEGVMMSNGLSDEDVEKIMQSSTSKH